MRGISFIDLTVAEGLDDSNVAVPFLISFAEKRRGENLFLIPCSDWYMEIVQSAREKLKDLYSFSIPDFEIWKTVSNKCSFVSLLDKFSIKHPKSLFINTKEDLFLECDIKFPAVLKPAVSSAYRKTGLRDKVYFPKDVNEAQEILQRVWGCGYKDGMILQELISFDNGVYRSAVLNTCSDKNGKIVWAVRANVLLEERSRSARGNYAALITAPLDEISYKLINMLEAIGYKGFANMDILYGRDGAVCLELNPRQGRSCDHLTAAGINLAESLFSERETDPTIFEYKKIFWSLIDHKAALKISKNEELKKEGSVLIKNGATASPYCPIEKCTAEAFIYSLLHKKKLEKRLKKEARD